MDFTEQYQDALQNIEFGIVTVYKNHPEIADYSVMRSLNALIDHYVAEKIGRPPKPFSLDEVETGMVRDVQAICDWRLGRPSSFAPPALESAPLQAISTDEIIQCLKRILKSVEKWNKANGRQGYLSFVSLYVH